MNEGIKPLTKGMKELLIELAARERTNLPPLPLHTQRHAKGLIVRGLVNITEYTVINKTITSITLNEFGKNYLQRLN